MKRKTITLVVYMLVCISLVSVGFAAWVITGGDSSNATGNINASTITDQSLTISEEQWDGGSVNALNAGQINFGLPADPNNKTKPIVATTGWLQASDVPVDKLEATFSFKVSSESNLAAAVKSATADFNDSTFRNKIPAGYIAEAVITHATASTAAGLATAAYEAYTPAALLEDLKVSATSIYVSIKITYAWGTKLGGNNPYTYFNSIDDENADSANGFYLLNGKHLDDEGNAVTSETTGATLVSNKAEAKYVIKTIFEAVNSNPEFSLTITLEGQGAANANQGS